MSSSRPVRSLVCSKVRIARIHLYIVKVFARKRERERVRGKFRFFYFFNRPWREEGTDEGINRWCNTVRYTKPHQKKSIRNTTINNDGRLVLWNKKWKRTIDSHRHHDPASQDSTKSWSTDPQRHRVEPTGKIENGKKSDALNETKSSLARECSVVVGFVPRTRCTKKKSVEWPMYPLLWLLMTMITI